MQRIADSYFPEALCLLAQLSLAAYAVINIRDNQDQFPIKQYSPMATITAILAFVLANLICLTGRILEEALDYKENCLTSHTQMYILAIFYNICRELPFVLFAIKTLRVSICFFPYFNRMYVENIKKPIISFFSSEAYIIFFSTLYVVVMTMLVVLIYPQGVLVNYFSNEFFCPKQTNAVDMVVVCLRLLSLGFVFVLSLWTYQELDFKKFIFLIFLTANLTVFPRVILYEFGKVYEYSHCIYYTSLLTQLLNTAIMAYYSRADQKLNQPPMQGVLQSWEAFQNIQVGIQILEEFAFFRDDHSDVKNYWRCLESYEFLDQIIKRSKTEDGFNLKSYYEVIENIVMRNQVVRQRLGATAAGTIISQCKDGTLDLKDFKRIEKILSNFCESELFGEWKKTVSYRYLKKEYINNGDINEKLELFKIPIY